MSKMSRAGLLGGRSEKTPPPLVTNFGSQRSRHDDESITPITPSTRRYSQPILVDSRLNPNAVLTFHGANASRESLASIDDSRDYGRQLNVRNP
jgi:cell wall integrity and stress response component